MSVVSRDDIETYEFMYFYIFSNREEITAHLPAVQLLPLFAVSVGCWTLLGMMMNNNNNSMPISRRWKWNNCPRNIFAIAISQYFILLCTWKSSQFRGGNRIITGLSQLFVKSSFEIIVSFHPQVHEICSFPYYLIRHYISLAAQFTWIFLLQ